MTGFCRTTLSTIRSYGLQSYWPHLIIPLTQRNPRRSNCSGVKKYPVMETAWCTKKSSPKTCWREKFNFARNLRHGLLEDLWTGVQFHVEAGLHQTSYKETWMLYDKMIMPGHMKQQTLLNFFVTHKVFLWQLGFLMFQLLNTNIKNIV